MDCAEDAEEWTVLRELYRGGPFCAGGALMSRDDRSGVLITPKNLIVHCPTAPLQAHAFASVCLCVLFYVHIYIYI